MINKSMNNNYRSKGFEMQRSKDEILRLSAKSIEVFAQSSKVRKRKRKCKGVSIDKGRRKKWNY
jgi:hypothetical protein